MIHRGYHAVAKHALDGLRRGGDARLDVVPLFGGEGLQDVVGSVERLRRTSDSEAQARKLVATEPLDDVVEPLVTAAAAAGPDPQATHGQVHVVETHE